VVGSGQVEAKQQKTVLGVVLLLLFGGLACCGVTVAIGAFSAYQDAQKAGGLSAFLKDAGVASTTPPDDVDPALGDEPAQDDPPAADDADAAPSKALPPLPVADLPADWDEAKGHVTVSVRDRVEVELSTLRGREPVSRPLADDLVEVIIYEGSDPVPLLTQDDLDGWEKTADEVFAHGRARLTSASKKAFTSPSPGVYESAFADGNDVARVVLFDAIRKLKVKGDPVIFIPEAGHLVVVGSKDTAGLEAAADIVDEHLRLPNPNTGRGWKLSKTGLEPWLPPSDSMFSLLRLEGVAKDNNDQKKVLDAKFEADGTDIFVGTTLFTDDDEGNKRTYAVWTKGADTLMPKAEMIVFVDLDQPEADRVVAAGMWNDIAPRLSSKMIVDSQYWPVRYRLKGFPDKKSLKAFGLHPLFQRGN